MPPDRADLVYRQIINAIDRLAQQVKHNPDAQAPSMHHVRIAQAQILTEVRRRAREAAAPWIRQANAYKR